MKERVRHFALFGNPVGHSLSPLMINAAFGAMGIRAGYEARRVEDLEPAVRMIREKPLDGVSVTLPLKGAVIAFLDEADDDAGIDPKRRAHAVRAREKRVIDIIRVCARLLETAQRADVIDAGAQRSGRRFVHAPVQQQVV